MVEQRNTVDHLLWVVPALLLGGVSPLILSSAGVGGPLIHLVVESCALFAALGVVAAGLLYYSLHRTRLTLFLSLSFLVSAFFVFLDLAASAVLVGFNIRATSHPSLSVWSAERVGLAFLLLLGLAFDRFAPVAGRALVEVVVAGVSVLTIAAVMVFALAGVNLPVVDITISGFPHPGQLWIGALYLVALPFYFRVFQSQRSHLWRAVVVSIVINVFAQVWMAGSAVSYDVPNLAAHAFGVVAYVTVLTGFQALGAQSERDALAAARRTRLILRVAEVASESGTDIGRVVERVAQAMVDVLDVVRVAILLPQPGEGALRVVGGYDTRPDFSPRVGILLPLASIPALRRAMDEGVVTRLPVDEQHVLDPDLLGGMRGAGIGVVTIVPLLVQGRSIGVVGISSLERERVLSPGDEALAVAIASQVAAVLGNVQLVADFEGQAHFQATLYQATASLNADLEPDELVAEIAHQLRGALGAEVCTISRWDPVHDVVITYLESWIPGKGPQGKQETIYKLDDYPLTRWALEAQEPVVIYTHDPKPEDAPERALLEEFGHQSLLMLPLIDKGTSIGLVELFDSASRRFQPREIDLAQALAQQAGAAFQRARLYHLERERSAQLSLLTWLAHALTGPIPEEVTRGDFARRLSLALSEVRVVLVYACDPDGETLCLSDSVGLPDELGEAPGVRRISRREVESVLTPDNPVLIPSILDEGSASSLLETLGLSELDPLGGVAVYVEEELAQLVLLAFAPDATPGEREKDFLLTLAASLSQNLISRRLFEKIAAERERLQAILTSVGEAIVLTSRRAEIVLLNPAAERLLGISGDEVVGYPLGRVLSHSAFEAIIARMLEGEVEDLERADVVLDDGRALLASVAPVRAADGETRGYVIDMADVTELQTLSEQKSEVLRMASHDLLNPLGQAMGAFEMLVEDVPPPDPASQELVDSVRAGHKRMNDLIKELLDLERLEAGGLGERWVVAVDGLVEGVLAEMGPLASERQRSLRAHLSPDLPPVSVDVTQMHRALCNLVDNAIKYTLPGGKIEIRAEAVEGRVMVAVSDDGVGVPQEEQARLFLRFYRARQPGTEHVTGTGLGLSLVKSVVELHGGSVGVKSVPGEGSTFTVTLPVANGHSS